jgi:ATP adenylyltransferase
MLFAKLRYYCLFSQQRRQRRVSVNNRVRSPFCRQAVKMLHTDATILWNAVKQATERAKAKGTIATIPTQCEIIEENGIRFVVRVAKNLAKKPTPTESLTTIGPPPVDPFSDPPKNELYVAGITPTHSIILNKFNVVDFHLVIVTNEFRPQSELLTIEDFEALTLVIQLLNGFGFYNAGQFSGASQPHKHLQWMPIAPDTGLPVEPLITKQGVSSSEFFSLNEFPFIHQCCRLSRLMPQVVLQHYRSMLPNLVNQVNSLNNSSSNQKLTIETLSYNLLLTEKWLMIVPRRADAFGNIGINSVGFTGNILVKSEDDLQILKRVRPLAVLKHVTFPRNDKEASL